MNLDAIDCKILIELQKDGRESASNIAEKINNLEDKIKYLDRIHMNDGK